MSAVEVRYFIKSYPSTHLKYKFVNYINRVIKILNSTMYYLAILFISSNQDSMDLEQDIKTTFCQPFHLYQKQVN